MSQCFCVFVHRPCPTSSERCWWLRECLAWTILTPSPNMWVMSPSCEGSAHTYRTLAFCVCVGVIDSCTYTCMFWSVCVCGVCVCVCVQLLCMYLQILVCMVYGCKCVIVNLNCKIYGSFQEKFWQAQPLLHPVIPCVTRFYSTWPCMSSLVQQSSH